MDQLCGTDAAGRRRSITREAAWMPPDLAQPLQAGGLPIDSPNPRPNVHMASPQDAGAELSDQTCVGHAAGCHVRAPSVRTCARTRSRSPNRATAPRQDAVERNKIARGPRASMTGAYPETVLRRRTRSQVPHRPGLPTSRTLPKLSRSKCVAMRLRNPDTMGGGPSDQEFQLITC